jgi:hypothetical protein
MSSTTVLVFAVVSRIRYRPTGNVKYSLLPRNKRSSSTGDAESIEALASVM